MNELNYITNLVPQVMKLNRGSYFENQFRFDYDTSVYTINMIRMHGGSYIKANKKNRFNNLEDLYHISFDIYNTGEYDDNPSECRFIDQRDEKVLAMLIQNENDWVYNLKTESGGITFKEETMIEEHFQFSTIQNVPSIETCFDVVKYMNSVHKNITNMNAEFGSAVRMNVSKNLTKKDADFLYNFIPGLVDMVTNL